MRCTLTVLASATLNAGSFVGSSACASCKTMSESLQKRRKVGKSPENNGPVAALPAPAALEDAAHPTVKLMKDRSVLLLVELWLS